MMMDDNFRDSVLRELLLNNIAYFHTLKKNTKVNRDKKRHLKMMITMWLFKLDGMAGVW